MCRLVYLLWLVELLHCAIVTNGPQGVSKLVTVLRWIIIRRQIGELNRKLYKSVRGCFRRVWSKFTTIVFAYTLNFWRTFHFQRKELFTDVWMNLKLQTYHWISWNWIYWDAINCAYAKYNGVSNTFCSHCTSLVLETVKKNSMELLFNNAQLFELQIFN